MLIILDRDGVINEDSVNYIKSPEEWIPIQKNIEGLAALYRAGHRFTVATNQSGLGRGIFTENALHQIHQKMAFTLRKAGVEIEKIYYCPHTPDDACECRKPKPGMLLQICKDFQMHPSECLFVGDSLRDVQAAQAAGCKMALVKTGNGLMTLQEPFDFSRVDVIEDLNELVRNMSVLRGS